MGRRKLSYRKTSAELLASSTLGSHARIFDEKEALELLRQAVDLEGSQLAFAKRHGLNRVHLVLVLQGKRILSDRFLKLLGLRKVYTADK